MAGDNAVSQFGYGGNSRNVLISPERPGASISQRTKDSFSRAVNAPVCFDKLDSSIKAGGRDFRKPSRNARMLERKIVDLMTGYLLPARDPIAAEVAIPIEDQQRPGWRRTDPQYFHKACLRLMLRSVEAVPISFAR